MKPVNLNHIRKERSQAEAKAQADLNAAKFGQTKAARLKNAAQTIAMQRKLDQARFEE